MTDPYETPDAPAAAQVADPPIPQRDPNAAQPPAAVAVADAPAPVAVAATAAPTWPQTVAEAAPDGEDGISHHMATLTSGSQGPDVLELVRLLKNLGYATNTIVAGTNFQNVLDGSVMADVRRFCADHDVANDPAEWIGREQPPQVFQETHVGPYIWEALYRLQPKAA